MEAAELETVVFSPSIVYTPGDPWITLLERFSYLPAIPVSGAGRSLYQPIWAEDVADCVTAALASNGGPLAPQLRAGRPADDLLRRDRAGGAAGERPPQARWCNVPLPVVRGSLRALGRVAGPRRSPPGRRRS